MTSKEIAYELDGLIKKHGDREIISISAIEQHIVIAYISENGYIVRYQSNFRMID